MASKSDPKTFCLQQARLELTNDQLARRLGVHINSVVKYRNGAPIPGPVRLAMKLLCLLHDHLEE